MQCLACATELIRPANFCPVCGARLSAPPPDGSSATLEGDAMPSVVHLAAEPDVPNVVYLPGASSSSAGAHGGSIPPNPHAGEYVDPVGLQLAGVPQSAPPPAAGPPPAAPFAAEGEGAQQAPALDPDNPFGNFFDDGPSAWLEDDAIDVERGMLPALLAGGAIGMLVAAWAVWGAAMVRGAGGAEAGGFLLLAMLLWGAYLGLPAERQHRWLVGIHDGITRFVDARTAALWKRTEGQMSLRRERDRYRAMRDERSRRIAALGESAYRGFRGGQLPHELHGPAQRVMAIERQMLEQDRRIASLARPDAAGTSDGGGHDVAP